ncbi:MAG TPA: hypothetical protein DCQ06_06605, partial [Myxococcales bacterium]|nr:hypothetical protein [Myxococcales bacterium]
EQEPSPPKPTTQEVSETPAEQTKTPKASAAEKSPPASDDLGSDEAVSDDDGDMQEDGAIDDEAPAKVKKPLPPVKLTLLQRLGPLITAGTGVLALGVGGILGVTAQKWAEQANALPSTRPDYQTQLQYYSDGAKSRALGATAAIIGGGVLAAAGTVWWVLSLRATQRTAWWPSNVEMTDRKWSMSWTF